MNKLIKIFAILAIMGVVISCGGGGGDIISPTAIPTFQTPSPTFTQAPLLTFTPSPTITPPPSPTFTPTPTPTFTPTPTPIPAIHIQGYIKNTNGNNIPATIYLEDGRIIDVSIDGHYSFEIFKEGVFTLRISSKGFRDTIVGGYGTFDMHLEKDFILQLQSSSSMPSIQSF